MKFSERWLREWVDPPVALDAMAEQLTRLGLEVDSVEPVMSERFTGVVAADVVAARAHPDADRLRICTVEVGDGSEPVEVVCGAPNARAGMRGALARPGARLGGGVKVRRARIRGAASEGMLCSVRELGIGEDHDGIVELDETMAPGADVYDLLDLDDHVIELGLTPDRGDCLSIAGVARELAAVNGLEASAPAIEPVASELDDALPVALEAPDGCARYAGRVVRGINPHAPTPLWMSERLRRCGLRSISLVVDVTNYVMLELGQPLHAFDLARLADGIRVRRARAGERLVLLDEREVELRASTLVIADHERPVALAGIMGGRDSGVGDETRDLFLESAWFEPVDLMGEARFYRLNTDASHRFERGVDPTGQRRALERATRLLIDIGGGQAGPIVDEASPEHLPARAPVQLREARVARVLGMTLPTEEIASCLRRLEMEVEDAPDGWRVTAPSHRFDIAIEEDLIEEVARFVGYDRVPAIGIEGGIHPEEGREASLSVERLRKMLVDRDYQEAVTYSFIDPELQSLLDPEAEPIRLSNPISSELAVMRTGVWVGLCDALVRNVNRQERRVRLFETGLRFRRDEALRARVGDIERWGDRGRDQVADVDQERCIAGVVTGAALPEQWGGDGREVDFFDVKSDVEALLALTGEPQPEERFRFVPATHPALHPGMTAHIVDARGGDDGESDAVIGFLGVLHPRVRRELRIPGTAIAFELSLRALGAARLPRHGAVSRFPAVRRDIALSVEERISAGDILAGIRGASNGLLGEVTVFDLYRGPGLAEGRKSVAIGLTFRSQDRTLSDEEVDALVADIVGSLRKAFGAELRGQESG